METSDESFVWTDASSDSSTKIEMKQITSRHDSNGDETGATLQEAVQVEQKQKIKKRKKVDRDAYVDLDSNTIDFDINTSIKSEPNSDFDVPKNKKKKINQENSYCNGTLLEAENYLNLRVKQEQITFVEPTSLKSKKRKKCKSESEVIDDGESEPLTPLKQENHFKEEDLDKSLLNNCEDSKLLDIDNDHRKKKKKKKTLQNGTLESYNRSELDIPENINKVKKTSMKKKSYSSKELIDDNSDSDIGEIVSSTLINNSIHHKSTTHNSSTLLSSSVNQISSIEGALRSSRISDRIRFEEEESIDFESKESVANSKLSNQLQQYISSSTYLRPFQCSLANSGITENDDIWILKGPHAIPVSHLKNCTLTLDGKKKVKVNGKSYDSIIDSSISIAPVLLCNKKTFLIQKIHVMGVIALRQRLPKVHIPYDTLVVSTDSSFIPLPDTKCRHPLFGSNYKKAMKIHANIVERLYVTDSNYAMNMEKRKKIKKKKEKVEMESEIEVKATVDVLHSDRQKKKRKHREEEMAPNKKKRKKKDQSCADVWESERAIEENLFNF